MPGTQPNVPGSAVALDALFAFGGGNPFVAPGSPAAKPGFRSTKAAFATERVKGPAVPDTANNTFVYDPATDSWTTSANMNTLRSFTSGAFIGNSNKIIAAGGFDGAFTLASAETLDACIPGPTPTPTPPPPSLWYNGDFNGVNGLANEENTIVTQAAVYDDFEVTDPSGWDVTSVYSNNLANTNVTGANWSIHQGISEGNGGTIVASGTTMTPVVTPTGRSGFGYTEYTVEVTGLSVHLPFSTDPYWLNVTPIGDFTNRSFDSSTSGANCTGTPCGNNQNAFFDSTYFGFVFASTGDPGIDQPYDFSMGVRGIGGGGNIRLRAGAHILDGTKVVRLHWIGATSPTVDIYRNDALLANANNDGSYTDVLTERGIYTYKVCEAGTTNCSNEVEVRFSGP
jgi:hypothetical protein